MKYIHSRRHLEGGQIVQLDCDTQCHFMLLSDDDYAAYREVQKFSYEGGTFKTFPARITVPASGYWNLVIDLHGAERDPHCLITVVE